MATLRIEYDYVKAKAAVLEENAQKIETILNGLLDDMQENINAGTWTGVAADNFKNEWNKSAEEFTNFVQYMKAVQSKVQTAGEEAGYFDSITNG